MTPPKVDIQALDSLYLEHLFRLDPNEAAKRFKGTDLTVDTKTGALNIGGKGESTSLEEELAWVQTIREADANKDHYVDLDEVKKLIGTLPPEQSATIDPTKFLESVDKLMKARYAPLSTNMKGWKSEIVFRPTLDALDLYNQGLLNEGYRHAGATIALNGLTKTLANVGGFISYPVRRIGGKTEVLWGDKKAMESAKKDFETRKEALKKLHEVIEKGVAANEPWAQEGKLEEAMKQLDAKTVAILNDQMAATEIHKILTTPDAKERYQKMSDFAKKERPGFLGFGTGNTKEGWFSDFWNYSGHRNNLFFARTTLHFLGTKAMTSDAAADDIMHKDARSVLSDINGDKLAGFNNLFSVGMTNLFCAGGKFCETTEYRDWSDEANMDALGRSIDFGIMAFGGNRAFTRWTEAWNLSKLNSARGVAFGAEGSLWQVWKASMAESKLNLLAGGKWGEAALAAEKEVELLGLAERSANQGRFWKMVDKVGRVTTWAKEKVFKGMPLSPEKSAMFEKGAKWSMDKFTRGFIMYSVANYADDKLSPPYYSFEHGLDDVARQADFEAYPDPTRPDPALNAPKK